MSSAPDTAAPTASLAMPASGLITAGAPCGRVRWSPASRRLVAIAAIILVLVAGALGLMIWQLRQNAIADARATVRTLGAAIAEQTSRSIQAADIVLQDLRTQIADKRLDSVDAFKEALGTEAQFRFLRDRADILPQIDAFTIIAADGKLVNYSRQFPAPPTDLSDRDYIAYFEAQDSPGTFVSAPVHNRGNGIWTCYLVRRVNGSRGQFLGLVLAAVDLDYFRDFFKTLTDQARTSVTLLKRDGTVLSGFPDTGPPGRARADWPAWSKLVAKGPGVLQSSGRSAASRQLVSVHPLPDYPLVVEVGLRTSLVLMDWVQTSLFICLVSLLTILCFVLLIQQQIRQFGRVERSETMLALRNTELRIRQGQLLRQADELSTGRTRMAEQSSTLQSALRHMHQGIIMVDAQDRVAVWNARAAAMLDLPAQFLASQPSFGAVMEHMDSIGDFDDPAARIHKVSYSEASAVHSMHERTRPNGTILQIHSVPMAGGGMVRTYTDVTERRRTEQQVSYLARHDAVTGLFNRTAFYERFETLLQDAARRGHRLGVFYIDLDGFKLVNDTHGHAVGDQLLATVAARLKSVIRESDTVARMGGDEFAVLQPFGGPGANIGDLARRMLDTIAEPYRFGASQCSVSLSIGVALYPDHAQDTAQLLHDADMALYRAKAGGKARYCVYDPAVDDAVTEVAMEYDLVRAIAGQQLYLDYQPIVDTVTLVPIRYEALLRWQHPVRGQVPPSDFVPVAEQSGLMVDIGLWTLETACRTALAWPDTVGLSVNLSPRQFEPGDLAEQMEAILARTGFPPARLNLEITEGVILQDSAGVTKTMDRLRALGVRFSLDDFGTAYAGFAYLRSFRFDVLKIDKSFVQDAARSEAARRLLGAIGAIGRAGRMQVVAEGVETAAELALVRELRCEHVQGYLLGRPGPVPA